MVARGVRLNNPGNIRHSADKWQGKSAHQPDKSFIAFDAPKWGIRAMARLLINYQDKYDCGTPREFISRWAPSVENDTESYVRAVCQDTGWMPMQRIDVHTYKDAAPLVAAIIEFENGKQPYKQSEIDEGLKLAGIVADPARGIVAEAMNAKTVNATVAATAATITATVAPIASVWDTLTQIIDPRILMWGVSLSLAIVAAYFVIERLKERREGRA